MKTKFICTLGLVAAIAFMVTRSNKQDTSYPSMTPQQEEAVDEATRKVAGEKPATLEKKDAGASYESSSNRMVVVKRKGFKFHETTPLTQGKPVGFVPESQLDQARR